MGRPNIQNANLKQDPTFFNKKRTGDSRLIKEWSEYSLEFEHLLAQWKKCIITFSCIPSITIVICNISHSMTLFVSYIKMCVVQFRRFVLDYTVKELVNRILQQLDHQLVETPTHFRKLTTIITAKTSNVMTTVWFLSCRSDYCELKNIWKVTKNLLLFLKSFFFRCVFS